MDDYIKREDAIRSIADHNDLKGERWIKEAWADYLIEYAQPADVAPIRHGRWIEDNPHSNGLASNWNCSMCGGDGDSDYNYCPNCGAKMDGDTK